MKIIVELEIEVEPFTREQLEAEGFTGEDAEPYAAEEVDAHGIGECIAAMFGPDTEMSDSALAGSSLFVRLGAASCLAATLK